MGRVGRVGRMGRVGRVRRVGRVGHMGRVGRVGRLEGPHLGVSGVFIQPRQAVLHRRGQLLPVLADDLVLHALLGEARRDRGEPRGCDEKEVDRRARGRPRCPRRRCVCVCVYLVIQRRPQAVQIALQLILRLDLLALVLVRFGIFLGFLRGAGRERECVCGGGGERGLDVTTSALPDKHIQTYRTRTLSMRSISSSDSRPLSDVIVIFCDLPDALSCADTWVEEGKWMDG